MSATQTRQVTLKTVILTFHQHLTEFFTQQRELSKCSADTCNLNLDTYDKLTRFISQCERIINTPSLYESLTIDQRMNVFNKQKEWIAIAEELKRVQLDSDSAFASANNAINGRVDIQTYKQFLAAKKQAYIHVQRENLIKKLLAKNNTQPAKKRVLPPVPDFEATAVACKIEAKNENAKLELKSEQKQEEIDNNMTIQEQDDDNLSTSDSTNSLSASHPKRAGYRSATNNSRPIELIQVIRDSKPAALKSNNSNSTQVDQSTRFSHSRFSRLEEELISLIERLSLSADASSTILKHSLVIVNQIAQSKSFFKNKSMLIISSAILIQACNLAGYVLTIAAIAKSTGLNERCIAKVHNQLVKEFSLVSRDDTQTLIRRVAIELSVANMQTLSASEYLFKAMCMHGLANGMRADLLSVSIVFLAATLNAAAISIEFVQSVFGISVDALSPTISTILEHKKLLINNNALFTMQHMLSP